MRPTAAQRRRWQRIIGQLACLVCGRPANIHHCRHNCGMSQKNHNEVAPLCKWCHQDGPVSRHGQGSKEFQERWPDSWLNEETQRRLGERV